MSYNNPNQRFVIEKKNDIEQPFVDPNEVGNKRRQLKKLIEENL